MTLAELREINNGFNPEKLEDHYLLLNVFNDCIHVIRLDDFHGDKNTFEVWNLVEVKDEFDFIKKYPKTYAIIYDNRFWIKD